MRQMIKGLYYDKYFRYKDRLKHFFYLLKNRYTNSLFKKCILLFISIIFLLSFIDPFFKPLLQNIIARDLLWFFCVLFILYFIFNLFNRVLNVWVTEDIHSSLKETFPEIIITSGTYIEKIQSNNKSEKMRELKWRRTDFFEKTKYHLDIFRLTNIIDFFLIFLIICGLLTIIAYSLTVVNSNSHFFNGIDYSKDGFIAHYYYMIITLITLGYGDIYPVHTTGGYIFGITLCIQSIIFVIMGVSLVISQTYYVLNKFEQEIDEELKILNDCY